MSRKKVNFQSKRRRIDYEIENESGESEDEYDDETDDTYFVPNPNYSGSSSDSDSEGVANDSDTESSANENPINFVNVSYQKVSSSYNNKQKKLEPDHEYDWKDGENCLPNELKDELLLSDQFKTSIRKKTPVEVFELFFCSKIKKHIIEASKLNGLTMSMNELNTYLAILLLSSYNIRDNYKEYWSLQEDLKCDIVRKVMSRDRFADIKSKIKYYIHSDPNSTDRAWRVREIIEMFRDNLSQFGFFSTALSIDEMMQRFFGRNIMKQCIRSKPDRFGFKFWALCTVSGFLLDFDLYCGSNATVDILSSCALGSRVVLQMIKKLLLKVPKRKLSQYHLYFDNYFTNPDLMIHLKKNGLVATGTVQSIRVTSTQHEMEKKAQKGTYKVSHDSNSGLNFITIMDSSKVSFLSTATGVSPKETLIRRQSLHNKEKIEIEFPYVMVAYNKFMGGVDLHDQRCKKVMPSVQSKKWTYSIFLRILQSSVVNATVLTNLCQTEGSKKISTKDFCRSIVLDYFSKSKKADLIDHKTESRDRKSCSSKKCLTRTTKYCIECNLHYCLTCFSETHKNK